MTTRRTRFGEVLAGLRFGAAYAFDQEATLLPKSGAATSPSAWFRAEDSVSSERSILVGCCHF
jgi:hypothetical protein